MITAIKNKITQIIFSKVKFKICQTPLEILRWPKRSKFLTGQTATELAIFGSILVFVIGVLISYTVAFNSNLQLQMEAFRMAMETSHGIDGYEVSEDIPLARRKATIIYIQDRDYPDISNAFGIMGRSAVSAQASLAFNRYLYYVQTDNPKDLPVIDMYINGRQFSFTTARYKEVTCRVDPCEDREYPDDYTPIDSIKKDFFQQFNQGKPLPRITVRMAEGSKESKFTGGPTNVNDDACNVTGWAAYKGDISTAWRLCPANQGLPDTYSSFCDYPGDGIARIKSYWNRSGRNFTESADVDCDGKEEEVLGCYARGPNRWNASESPGINGCEENDWPVGDPSWHYQEECRKDASQCIACALTGTTKKISILPWWGCNHNDKVDCCQYAWFNPLHQNHWPTKNGFPFPGNPEGTIETLVEHDAVAQCAALYKGCLINAGIDPNDPTNKTLIKVYDYQEGEIDLTIDDFDLTHGKPRQGIISESKAEYRVEPGTVLEKQEDLRKIKNITQVKRTDIITRIILLNKRHRIFHNRTDERYPRDAVTGERANCEMPECWQNIIDQTDGGNTVGDCLGANKYKTCFDPHDMNQPHPTYPKLYIRSRLEVNKTKIWETLKCARDGESCAAIQCCTGLGCIPATGRCTSQCNRPGSDCGKGLACCVPAHCSNSHICVD